jgi:hypothetical protein
MAAAIDKDEELKEGNSFASPVKEQFNSFSLFLRNTFSLLRDEQ